MAKTKLEPCYYGDRKVIYVQVRYPDQANGSKTVSVYGHSFGEVLEAVDVGLSAAFGKVGAPRPPGRPAATPKSRKKPTARSARR